MAPAPVDPPSTPPLGHLTHPRPHPQTPPSPPHPASWALFDPKIHGSTQRQKIVSVLWHSLVLLLVGGSTGRWAGLPRREEEGGRRTPGPGHQTREHTVNSLLLSSTTFSYDTQSSLKRNYWSLPTAPLTLSRFWRSYVLTWEKITSVLGRGAEVEEGFQIWW